MKFTDLDKANDLCRRRVSLIDCLEELTGSVIEVVHSQGAATFTDVFTIGAVTMVQVRDFLIEKTKQRIAETEKELAALGIEL